MFRKFAPLLTLLLFSPTWSQTSGPPNTEPSKDVPNLPAGQTEDSKNLIVIKAKKPIYPITAEDKQIQGRVWVKIFIDESGNVERVEVVEGNPLLVDSAVDAVKQWKFKPYIKGGKPVKVNVKLPVDFAFANQIKDGDTSASTASTDTHDPLQKTTISSNTNSQPAAVPENSTGPMPTRVRVSQGVTAALLVHRVNPIYPMEAKRNHTQGRVLLNAVIGTDGNIKDLKVASGPKELIDAAVGAVQQWRYRPYLFNGQPIEVETTIEVNFQLAR